MFVFSLFRDNKSNYNNPTLERSLLHVSPGYVKYAVKYVYVDLPAFQNTQYKFTKESSLNCHKKSLFYDKRQGKRLVN